MCLMQNQNPNEIITAEEIPSSMDWQQEPGRAGTGATGEVTPAFCSP